MFTTKADFSKMSSSGAGNLKVDKIVHKSFVDVNENGTEAAAVTGKDPSAPGDLFEEFQIKFNIFHAISRINLKQRCIFFFSVLFL